MSITATRLAHARTEVEQARLERDRLGIDIGSVPPAMQVETYRAAAERLFQLEVAYALEAGHSVTR